MFKVVFNQNVGVPDKYVVADYFTTYDRFITFYIKLEAPNTDRFGYGIAAVDTYSGSPSEAQVVGAFAGEHVFSVTKVEGQPFDPNQSGDTAEDI